MAIFVLLCSRVRRRTNLDPTRSSQRIMKQKREKKKRKKEKEKEKEKKKKKKKKKTRKKRERKRIPFLQKRVGKQERLNMGK